MSENFDGVTVPALPSGWTTTTTGANAPFQTMQAGPDTPPNYAFTNNPPTAGSAELTSVPVVLGSVQARISFRHRYITEFEPGYDGGVLEISVNNGPFQDILAAGGSFISGGYTQPLNPDATGNPLLGRQVWTGDSQIYVTCTALLPMSASNQTVRFRWRYGTDEIKGGTGWRIDTVTVTDQTSTAVVGYTENFDAVTVPQLPQNWSSTQTGAGTGFRTQTASPDTPPNTVFTSDPNTAGLSELQSPQVRVGANSPKLIFRNAYSVEGGFDGGVLEIKIGAGPYQDILAAGGTFFSGGYNSTLTTGYGNPIEGRQAWTGTTGGAGTTYVTTEIDLPPAAYRQLVQFKWRFGSDGSVAGVGWRIDSVLITNAVTGDNPSAISVPLSGPASPYPSQISVSELEGRVTSLEVNLQGLTHTSPDDVDVLLMSPSGRCVVLMSDVGGTSAVSNLALTVDDAAPAALPDDGPLQSGRFRPSDFEPGDVFPDPQPGCTSVGSTLGHLFNSAANGVWKLFVADDTGSNSGSITNGWSLIINSSPTAIAIPAGGLADPYPSGIGVSGLANRVSKVTVSIENFSHSRPDDVDLMLVAPNGRKVILLSDAGGATSQSRLNLTFDDAATASVPDESPFGSGSYRPTDHEPGDAFPSPAPGGAVAGRMLAALNGSAPNGQWNLFLVDDNGDNAGTINAWTLSLQTSADIIDIPASGAADPYPAQRTVTGFPGNVTRVTVNIPNFSHTLPDDVDILLEAPNGRRVVLMSDAGGSSEVGGLNLTFDDQAPAALPDSSPLASGSYKPTDYEAGDIFPAPAPDGPHSGSTLQAFYGSPPNGIWKLYVADDTGENLGSIAAAWNLNLQTSTSACLFSISPSVQAFPVSGGSGGFSVTMPTGCFWNAASDSSFVTISSPPSGGGNGSLTFDVAPNFGPPRSATITVSNGVTVRSFQVQQASGCPFAPSESVVNVPATGGARSVGISAGSGCSWQGSSNASWIQVTSGQQSGNGSISFTVQPNSGLARRQATITVGSVTIVVNQAGQSGARFDFDGDLRADVAVFRPSNGSWWVQNSGSPGTHYAAAFGLSSDRPTPADYDGDRKADIAVYRDGTWYLLLSASSTVGYAHWGLAGDIPVPEDFDGDGRADAAVYRPSQNVFYTTRSSDGGSRAVQFGAAGDHPVAADFDGDGLADIAVYRAGASTSAQSTWIVLNSSTGATTQVQYGVGEDVPVPADYDADGRTNVAVFRPSTGTWYTSLDPATNYGAVRWGTSGDVPAAADFDGDGTADVAVYRVNSWYILHRSSGSIRFEQWGASGDRALPAAFQP